MTPSEMKIELRALAAVVEARLAMIFADGSVPGPLAVSMDHSDRKSVV